MLINESRSRGSLTPFECVSPFHPTQFF